MVEVNHVDRRHFDKHLANIAPCNHVGSTFTPDDSAYCSLYLHPTLGFQWDQQVVGEEGLGYGGTEGIQPTG